MLIIMKNLNDDNGDDDHDVKPWNASQSVAPRPLKPRSPAQPPPRTASNDHFDHCYHNHDDQPSIIMIVE